MCCFSVADVFLEDPPPEKKKEEKEKEKEKVNKNFVLVSDQLNLQPITSPAPMHYPGGSQSPHIQFHTSQPAAEPANFNVYKGLTSQQVNERNISRAQNLGGYDQVQLVPQNASPDNEYYCRELDGTYTVRTVNTIMNTLTPGQWAYASTGYPYWVRHAKT